VRSTVFTSDEGAPLPLVSQLQTLLAGVAELSESTSWLTADAQIDNGFSLELGIVGSDCKIRDLFEGKY
jgi:hypothetical protein